MGICYKCRCRTREGKPFECNIMADLGNFRGEVQKDSDLFRSLEREVQYRYANPGLALESATAFPIIEKVS